MPTIQVQLEEGDYVRAAQAAAGPSKPTVVGLSVASVLIVLALVVGGRAGFMRQAFVASFVWFFGLGGAWVGHTLSIVTKAKRVFRQQKALQRLYEVSWDGGGLTVAGESSQSTTRWSDFYKLRELDDLFLLYFSDALFLMIPKRAFPESDLVLKFRETVTTAIPRR
jgi:hypothetical protein